MKKLFVKVFTRDVRVFEDNRILFVYEYSIKEMNAIAKYMDYREADDRLIVKPILKDIIKMNLKNRLDSGDIIDPEMWTVYVKYGTEEAEFNLTSKAFEDCLVPEMVEASKAAEEESEAFVEATATVTEQSKAIDALIIKDRIEDITADIIAGYVNEGVDEYIHLYMNNYDLLRSDYIDHYHYHNKVLQALWVREQAARMHGDELEIERINDAREWISDMRALSKLKDGTIVNELYA